MAGRIGKVAKIENEARAQAEAQAHAEAERQREHQRTLEEEARRRQTAAFMEREGLKTVEDCRAYVRRTMRAILTRDLGSVFERWAENMRQDTVDRLTITGTDDDKRLLARLQGMRVIDAQAKIIPIEQRAELRQKDAEERKRIEAEIEERRRKAAEYVKAKRKGGRRRDAAAV